MFDNETLTKKNDVLREDYRFSLSNYNDTTFVSYVNKWGYGIVEDVIDKDFIQRLKEDLVLAIDEEVQYHKGVNYKDYGMVLMCCLYGKSFTDIFDESQFVRPLNAVLGERSIVYSYTSSSMPSYSTNYSRRIHIDCPRLIPGYITNFGALIALDDFTEDNGATWFLPGSCDMLSAPTEEYFYQHAKRLTIKAGSVFYFNGRLWHCGGDNKTDQWRHAVTMNLCRPWMKQRIDIPAAMISKGKEELELSKEAAQKLGFYCQVPLNYDEYFLPLEKRKYKQPIE